MYKTKKQMDASLSSTESEFKSFSEVAKELMWLKHIFEFLDVDHEKIRLFNDNQSAIKMAKNSGAVKRTRHLELKYFFINEKIERRELEIDFIEGLKNVADGFTKSLGKSKFEEFCKRLYESETFLNMKMREDVEVNHFQVHK